MDGAMIYFDRHKRSKLPRASLLWLLLLLTAAHSTFAQMIREFVANGPVQLETFSIGHGPLVMIVPSTSRGSEDYFTFAKSLSSHGYRVLCVNPRGIGASSPVGTSTTHDSATDLAAILRQQSPMSAVVIGHAGGSFAARMLATDFPALVRGIVLAAPGTRTSDPALSDALRQLTANNLPDPERLKLLQFAFFAPGNNAAVWLNGWYSRPGGLPPSPAQSASASGDPRDAWWGAGHAKVLELIPMQDAFRPPGTRGDYKAAYGDRITTETIPNAGHALFPEQPRAVEEAILGWMATL